MLKGWRIERRTRNISYAELRRGRHCIVEQMLGHVLIRHSNISTVSPIYLMF